MKKIFCTLFAAFALMGVQAQQTPSEHMYIYMVDGSVRIYDRATLDSIAFSAVAAVVPDDTIPVLPESPYVWKTITYNLHTDVPVGDETIYIYGWSYGLQSSIFDNGVHSQYAMNKVDDNNYTITLPTCIDTTSCTSQHYEYRIVGAEEYEYHYPLERPKEGMSCSRYYFSSYFCREGLVFNDSVYGFEHHGADYCAYDSITLNLTTVMPVPETVSVRVRYYDTPMQRIDANNFTFKIYGQLGDTYFYEIVDGTWKDGLATFPVEGKTCSEYVLENFTANSYSMNDTVYGFVHYGADLCEEVEISSMSIDSSRLTFQEGSTYPQELRVVFYPSTATPPAAESIVWKSSNPEIAQVDANGVVTAVSEGAATITATYGEFVAECSVFVNGARRAWKAGGGGIFNIYEGILPTDTIDVPASDGSSYRCVSKLTLYVIYGDKISVDAEGYLSGEDYAIFGFVPVYVITEGAYAGYTLGGDVSIVTNETNSGWSTNPYEMITGGFTDFQTYGYYVDHAMLQNDLDSAASADAKAAMEASFIGTYVTYWLPETGQSTILPQGFVVNGSGYSAPDNLIIGISWLTGGFGGLKATEDLSDVVRPYEVSACSMLYWETPEETAVTRKPTMEKDLKLTVDTRGLLKAPKLQMLKEPVERK